MRVKYLEIKSTLPTTHAEELDRDLDSPELLSIDLEELDFLVLDLDLFLCFSNSDLWSNISVLASGSQ